MTLSLTLRHICFALLCSMALGVATVHAQLSDPVPLSGYAWSSNVGWISFSGPGYQVTIETDGDLTGYAWSSSVGWIRFDGWSTPPAGTGRAYIDFSTNEFSGWARACVATSDANCLSETGTADGWDGWISLNCDNTGSCGTSNYAMTANGGNLANFAWGSEVLGWIEMTDVTYTPPATPGLQCLSDLSGYEQIDQWGQVVNTTYCSGGYICDTDNPGTCVANTLDGAVTARPARVREGGTLDITWSSTDAISCTVERQNPAGAVAESWTGLSGTETSGAVTSLTVVSLQCTNAGGIPEYEVASTTVEVIPLNIET